MHFVPLQFVHETRRLRPWLVAWSATVALHVVLTARLLSGTWVWDTASGTTPLAVHSSFWLVLVPGVFVVKALAAGDGRPMDATAFWQAKPMQGVHLAGAKLLFIFVFLFGLPLVADLLLLTRHAGAGPIWVEHVALRLSVYVIVLALTLVAGNAVRVAIGFVAGFFVLVGVTTAMTQLPAWGQLAFTPHLGMSRFLVAGLIALIGSVWIVFHLCRKRTRGPAYAAIAATIATIYGVFLVWPIDFFERGIPAGELSAAQVDEIDVVWDDPAVYAWEDTWRARIVHGVRVPFNVAGLPEGWMAGPARGRLAVTIKSPTGQRPIRMASGPWRANSIGVRVPGEPAALAHVLRERISDNTSLPLPKPFGQSFYDIRMLFGRPLPDAPLPGSPAAKAEIEVSAVIDLHTFEPVGSLPWREGAELSGPGYRIRFGAPPAAAPDGLLLSVEEQVVQPVFSRRGPITRLPHGGGPFVYVLLDKERKAVGAFDDPQRMGRFPLPGQGENPIFRYVYRRERQFLLPMPSNEPTRVSNLVVPYIGCEVLCLRRVYQGSIKRSAVLRDVLQWAPGRDESGAGGCI